MLSKLWNLETRHRWMQRMRAWMQSTMPLQIQQLLPPQESLGEQPIRWTTEINVVDEISYS